MLNNYIEIYNEILEGKRKRFPRGFWKNNKKEKAKIIFKYLFEEVLKWNTEKLITNFNYKIVSQYKLTSPLLLEFIIKVYIIYLKIFTLI